jgi:hypothetical protein
MGEEEEKQENGYALDKAELELFHEVLFKRIMDVMDKPEVDLNPFEQAYDKDPNRLKEDEQGYNAKKEEKKRRSLIKKDLDKLSLYL